MSVEYLQRAIFGQPRLQHYNNERETAMSHLNRYMSFLVCLGICLFLTAGCGKKQVVSDPSVSLISGELLPDDPAAARQAEDAESRRRIEEERLLEEQRLREEQQLASQMTPRKGETQFMSEHIYFEFDSALLTAESQEKLRAKARWLHDHSGISVMLEGHTDERGSIVYNLALGERRAESVKTFLMGLGIAPSRMFTISYGEERPLDSRSVEEAWALNRRVQFVVID